MRCFRHRGRDNHGSVQTAGLAPDVDVSRTATAGESRALLRDPTIDCLRQRLSRRDFQTRRSQWSRRQCACAPQRAQTGGEEDQEGVL